VLFLPSRGCDGVEAYSEDRVRFFNGELQLAVRALTAKWWGHTLVYSNRLSEDKDFGNGWNWMVKEWWQLFQVSGSRTLVLRGSQSSLWFSSSNGPLYGSLHQLTHDTTAKTYTLTSPNGATAEFYDFDAAHGALKGKLKALRTPANKSITVNYDLSNRLSYVEMSFVDGSTTYREKFTYTYFSSGANNGQLQDVTVSRDPGTGTYADKRRVRFEYYGSGEANGSPNDLKRVVSQFKCPTNWTDHDVQYFRYYGGASSSSSSSGGLSEFAHGLKLAVGPQAYFRGTGQSVNWDTATDATVKTYADHYVEYDSSRRVTKNVVVHGTYTNTYAYSDSAFGDGFNNWKRRTTRTAPDGSQLKVYTNYVGQVMLQELNSGTTPAKKWIDHQQFDSTSAYLTLRVHPSGINMSGSPYSEGSASLSVQLQTNVGLFQLWAYSAQGYLTFAKTYKGTSGASSPDTVLNYVYSSQVVGSTTLYKLDQERMYRNSGGGGTIDTYFTYTFYSGTFGVNTRLVQLPTVPTNQNGTGNTVYRRELYDDYGNVTVLQDERLYYTTYTFDLPTGTPKQMVQDVAQPQSVSTWPPAPGSDGDRMNLTTDYEIDDEGRVTQELGPSHSVDLGGTATTIRTATWHVYLDRCGATYDEVWTGQGYATGSAPYTFTLVNPVSLSRRSRDGWTVDSIVATRASTSGRLSESDSFAQTSWVRWTSEILNVAGNPVKSRLYYKIPPSGEGSIAANYNQTEFKYEINTGRQDGVKTPGGTITRTKFDVRGLLTEIWVGTNDFGFSSHASHNFSDSGTNNMTKVSSNVYDGNNEGKNGNLTSTTSYVDSDSSHDRTTTFLYDDYRDRQIKATAPDTTYTVPTYDNFDRVTILERFTSADTRIGKQATNFDEMGRVYETLVYSVSDGGTPGAALVDKTWHDDAGNAIKRVSSSSEAFTKTDFDAVGRVTSEKIGYFDGSNDRIYAQTDTSYDAASNVIQATQLSRYHDDSSTTGSLTTSNSRPFYTAMYPDAIGRQQAVAVYGNAGTSFSRSATVPARSDTTLVTSTTFNSRGEAETETDPRGIVSKDEFDDAGRQMRHIENYLSGGSSSSGACVTADQNVTTEWAYNADGRAASVTALNATTGNQTTSYTYDATTGSGGSNINSKDLLTLITFADGSTAAFRYNAQGERIKLTDQNVTVHDYTYDTSARLTADTVSAFGTGIDSTINKIGLAYDGRGRLQRLTTYKNTNPATVQNEILNEYNGLDMLVKQYQEHIGAKTDSSLYVEFNFDTTANGVFTKGMRPTSIRYPNGRNTRYAYGSGANDKLGRLDSIKDDNNTTVLAQYWYLGLSRVVIEQYVQAGVELNYTGSTGQYPGLDPFDRVAIQLWKASVGGAEKDKFEYRYDRNSNALCQKNHLLSGKDELYAYDALDRLVDFKRGTLSSLDPPAMSSTPVRQETFGLDATANWKCYDIAENGSATLNQRRTHNKLNEITRIDETSPQPAWFEPVYDANANMTKAPQPNNLPAGYDLIYDAWNRVVEVKTTVGGTTVAKYEYDALNHRVVKFIQATGIYEHFYYGDEDRLLETRKGSSSSSIPTAYDQQHVPSVLNSLPVMYDRSIGSGASSSSSSGAVSPSRLFMTSGMAGITGLTDGHGSVVERYEYDSYGSVTVLDASGGPVSGNQSQVANSFTRIGRLIDYESGLYVCDGLVHARLGQFCNGGANILPYQPADDPFEAFRKRMEEEERRRKKLQEEEDLVEYHDCISGRIYLIPRRLIPGWTPPRRGSSNRQPPGTILPWEPPPPPPPPSPDTRPGWQKKCDPQGSNPPSPTPPPSGEPREGDPCYYPDRWVCEKFGGVYSSCWESQCVCQCVGDSPTLNCIRACIRCADENGAPHHTIEAEEYCRKRCPPLTPNEQRRLECCTIHDYTFGGCRGSITSMPKNPNRSGQCMQMKVP
jgi:YD repeat-containing protein